MKWLRSFRWRILFGAFLWTLGLIPLLHLFFLFAHGVRIRLTPRDMAIFLILSFSFMVAGIWQVRAGFQPFDRLRRQLLGLRDGSTRRIEGIYPTEVQPLVNDLNSLLEHRDRVV